MHARPESSQGVCLKCLEGVVGRCSEVWGDTYLGFAKSEVDWLGKARSATVCQTHALGEVIALD